MISTALLAGVFAFGAVASVQLADYTAYRVDSDVSSSDPSVKINKVATANPWVGTKGTITVDYALAGIDAGILYKVAFDVTAKNEIKGVTNDWAKLTDGAATKSIDTAALFGKEIVDKDATVKISLIEAVLAPPPAGQLWEGGPIWAENNLGTSEVEGHSEYGALYTLAEATNAVVSIGQGWRVPSKDDFDKLINDSYCTKGWDDTKKCWTFTGKGEYSSNSISLAAAGHDSGSGRNSSGVCGYYLSSTVDDDPRFPDTFDRNLYFTDNGKIFMTIEYLRNRMSVRAVRDDTEGRTIVDEKVVATAKVNFWLGPGCECCPWTLGEGVTAYVKDRVLYLLGEGKVAESADGAPWAEYDDMLEGAYLPRKVKVPASVAATLPISVEGVVSSGAVSADFERVQIANGKAYLGVSVCTNGDVTVTTEGWGAAKLDPTTVEQAEDGKGLVIPVPATAEKGFMILKSRGTEPSNRSGRPDTADVQHD